MEFRLHHIIDHLYNIFLENDSSDPTSDDQVSALKCHPWIGMLTHTILEDL